MPVALEKFDRVVAVFIINCSNLLFMLIPTFVNCRLLSLTNVNQLTTVKITFVKHLIYN